jgi:hypothetical protein
VITSVVELTSTVYSAWMDWVSCYSWLSLCIIFDVYFGFEPVELKVILWYMCTSWWRYLCYFISMLPFGRELKIAVYCWVIVNSYISVVFALRVFTIT